MDAQYLRRADACLERIAQWLEDFDPDELDYSTADGVVTLEFADGKKYVLSRQSAASQMWLAADARAWHYGWDEARGSWSDDRDGHDLYERISGLVSDKLGRAVAMQAPGS